GSGWARAAGRADPWRASSLAPYHAFFERSGRPSDRDQFGGSDFSARRGRNVVARASGVRWGGLASMSSTSLRAPCETLSSGNFGARTRRHLAVAGRWRYPDDWPPGTLAPADERPDERARRQSDRGPLGAGAPRRGDPGHPRGARARPRRAHRRSPGAG